MSTQASDILDRVWKYSRRNRVSIFTVTLLGAVSVAVAKIFRDLSSVIDRDEQRDSAVARDRSGDDVMKTRGAPPRLRVRAGAYTTETLASASPLAADLEGSRSVAKGRGRKRGGIRPIAGSMLVRNDDDVVLGNDAPDLPIIEEGSVEFPVLSE
jgi:hypothetical protein